MDRAAFHNLLRGSRVVASTETTLTVAVRSPYSVGWLQNRLLPVVERIVQRLAGRPVAVAFVAASPSCGPDPYPDPDPAPDQEPEPDLDPDPDPAPPRLKAPPPPPPRDPRPSPAKTMAPTDYYIRLKIAFRVSALAKLKGAPLSVFFSLALHLNDSSVASPGIETIMRETNYARGAVCSALATLENLGLVTKRPCHHRPTEYIVNAYAWWGRHPAPALFEEPGYSSLSEP